MPRPCSVCTHASRREIDAALVAGSEPIRTISGRFSLSQTALKRHKAEHVPQRLAMAQEASEVAAAGDLLRHLQALRNKAVSILIRAESEGDLRAALMAIREARQTIEVLAELEGELDRRAQVTILNAPAWIEMRSAVVAALAPYPDARAAVVAALGAGDGR